MGFCNEKELCQEQRKGRESSFLPVSFEFKVAWNSTFLEIQFYPVYKCKAQGDDREARWEKS